MKEVSIIAPTKSHFLRNLIIGFSAALALLGIVLGTVSILTNAKTYARYGGTIADKAAYSYLASNYKFNFCRSLTARGIEIDDSLWEKKPEGGDKTYGELLESGTKEYISRILVAAALFDSAATAAEKKEAKAEAKKAAEELLTYRSDGDKQAFNEITAPYGYAYADLADIALLLYKATAAQSLFYGVGGANVTDRLEDCNLYLEENYSAAYLFVIRTESTFIYNEDENGAPIFETDGSGAYATRPLREEEIAQRNALIAKMDAEIASGNPRLPFFKDEMKKHYDIAPEGNGTLYYLADNAAYTQGFIKENGESIPEALKSMEVGEFKKVTYKHGVCYIYKNEVEENAFGVTDYKGFFSDFYQNAADFMFAEDVGILIEDTVFKARASSIPLTTIPYKNIIRVRF
jgi:hypothetical protein